MTDEILLSPAARRIPLEEGDDAWAQAILSVRQSAPDRAQGEAIVRQAGYDIHTEGQKLQALYLKMAERA